MKSIEFTLQYTSALPGRFRRITMRNEDYDVTLSKFTHSETDSFVKGCVEGDPHFGQIAALQDIGKGADEGMLNTFILFI